MNESGPVEYSEDPGTADKAKPKLWCPMHYWPFYGDCNMCTLLAIRDSLKSIADGQVQEETIDIQGVEIARLEAELIQLKLDQVKLTTL